MEVYHECEYGSSIGRALIETDILDGQQEMVYREVDVHQRSIDIVGQALVEVGGEEKV